MVEKSPDKRQRSTEAAIMHPGNKGILAPYRRFEKACKDEADTTCEIPNFSQVFEIGGKMVDFDDIKPPEPLNKTEVKFYLDAIERRENMLINIHAQYVRDMEIYGQNMELRHQTAQIARAAWFAQQLEANPEVQPPEPPDEVIEQMVIQELGPEPNEPLLVIPPNHLPHVLPIYDPSEKAIFDARVKSHVNNEEKIKRDTAKAFAIMHSKMSPDYLRELEAKHWHKQLIKDRNIPAYKEQVMLFHLTEDKVPEVSTKNMKQKLQNARQYDKEDLTKWAERVQDMNTAIEIVGKKCDPPATPLTEKEMVILYIMGLHSTYSKFKEGYERADKKFPDTMSQAIKAAEVYGKDKAPPKSETPHRGAVFAVTGSNTGSTERRNLKCDWCEGGFHTEAECKYKLANVSKEQARAARKAKKAKKAAAKAAN